MLAKLGTLLQSLCFVFVLLVVVTFFAAGGVGGSSKSDILAPKL